MIPSDHQDDDALAGEYVLGTLDAETARSVETRLETDAGFAQRVAFWERSLFPAVASLPAAPAAAGLWSRIERSLQRDTDQRPPAVPSGARARRSSRLGRIWHDPAVWRATTALAVAATILLAVQPRGGPQAPGNVPRYFALLQTRDSGGAETGPGWLIQIAQDGTVSSLPLADVHPASGQALQLWTLWDPSRGPVSLGVLPAGGSVRLPPERLEVIRTGQLFEITLEPEAGSPTGRPTGRVLFIGRTSVSASQSL